MTSKDLFRRLVDALDQAGIPYMLTGSFASSYHGAARATQDIDLVVAPTAEQVRTLVHLLPPDRYYVSLPAALDAIERETQFNVIDFDTGWKVDLIIRKSRPFSLTEFDRRTVVDVEGLRLYIARAEDVVISKLEWARRSGSARQMDDAAGILRIRWPELDHAYLAHWIQTLGLVAQWQEACRMAGTAV